MADVSMLYTVATNQNVKSDDHNTVVQAIQNVNAEALSNGNAQLIYDAFGNLTGATDGDETYAYTYGAFAMIASASDGTTTVTLNRTDAGTLTGFTTT